MPDCVSPNVKLFIQNDLYHLQDSKAFPIMLRKESEAVPEGNGPVPQTEEFKSGQPTWGDAYRWMKEAFDRWDRKLDEIHVFRRPSGLDFG